MSDRVMKVSYCYVMVPNRAGQGAKVFTAIREGGVNLMAHVGFPGKRGKAQLDFVAPNLSKIRSVARKNGWRVSRPRRRFWSRARISPARSTVISPAWQTPGSA